MWTSRRKVSSRTHIPPFAGAYPHRPMASWARAPASLVGVGRLALIRRTLPFRSVLPSTRQLTLSAHGVPPDLDHSRSDVLLPTVAPQLPEGHVGFVQRTALDQRAGAEHVAHRGGQRLGAVEDPTGTFVPSAVMASATTQQRSAM